MPASDSSPTAEAPPTPRQPVPGEPERCARVRVYPSARGLPPGKIDFIPSPRARYPRATSLGHRPTSLTPRRAPSVSCPPTVSLHVPPLAGAPEAPEAPAVPLALSLPAPDASDRELPQTLGAPWRLALVAPGTARVVLQREICACPLEGASAARLQRGLRFMGSLAASPP